jgi:hypothetical protein
MGWVWIQPDSLDGPTVQGYKDTNGFGELVFGPKFTFLRNDRSNTLIAGGLNFEIASGSYNAFQKTGNGGVTPYLSFGQQFGGNWHFLSTTGYRFSFSSMRSEAFFSSFHLDYGIYNRIYPLVELNWWYYAMNGQNRTTDFEGGDQFMFGSTDISGQSVVTFAAGVRFKFTEWWHGGVVYEFPLTTKDNLMNYRLTFDMIFRY